MQLQPPEKNPAPPARGPRRLTGLQVALLLLFGAGVFAVIVFLSPGTPELLPPQTAPDPAARTPPAQELRDATNEYQRGDKLAHTVCISCHLFPEPALLDRVTWAMEVLPRMETWLGLTDPDFNRTPGGDRVKAAKIYPEAPAVSAEDWRAICTYYLEAAPARFLPPTDRPKLEVDLKQFKATNAKYRQPDPRTTLLKIDEQKHQLYVGDAEAKTLSILNALGEVQTTLPMESAPVNLLLRPDGLYVTLIGSVAPSDLAQGKLLQLERSQPGSIHTNALLAALSRPTDVVFADLNGDGREDLIICQYGNILGHLSWFENLGNGKFKEHILIKRPAPGPFGR